MQGENKERWRVLCAQAVEQDPEKLLELVTEIDAMLAAKEERLLKARRPDKPDTP